MQHKAQRRHVVPEDDDDDEGEQKSTDELKRIILAGAPALPDSIALTHLLDPPPYELLRAELKSMKEDQAARLAHSDTQLRKEMIGFESRIMKQIDDVKSMIGQSSSGASGSKNNIKGTSRSALNKEVRA